MIQNIPKLSLVAQYDDLCRYTKILTTGSEDEFKTFVENQLNYFQSVKDIESEVWKLSEKNSLLKTEKTKLETRIKYLVNQNETEKTKRMQVEKEKSCMERQLIIIREVLLSGNNNLDNQTREKLAFLNETCKLNSSPCLDAVDESCNSLFSLSDVDDLTEDDLESRNRKSSYRKKSRNISTKNRISPKRKKSKDDQFIVNEFYDENRNISFKKIRGQNGSESDDLDTCNNYNLRSQQMKSPRCNLYIGFGSSENFSQMHKFSPKTVIRTDKCSICHQNIGFFKQALKCDDCKVICHSDCQNNCIVQCIRKVDSPFKNVTNINTDNEAGVIYADVLKSPESTTALKETRLGPIFRRRMSSRNSKSRKVSDEIQFSSPLLK